MADEPENGKRDTRDLAAEEQPRQRRKPGPRPGTEAAKRGGSAARDKYGREFYSRIGAKGGSKVRDRHGTEFYTEIGRRGGESTKRNLGSEHYSRIGRIGGKRAHGNHNDGAEGMDQPNLANASESAEDRPSPSA